MASCSAQACEKLGEDVPGEPRGACDLARRVRDGSTPGPPCGRAPGEFQEGADGSARTKRTTGREVAVTSIKVSLRGAPARAGERRCGDAPGVARFDSREQHDEEESAGIDVCEDPNVSVGRLTYMSPGYLAERAGRVAAKTVHDSAAARSCGVHPPAIRVAHTPFSDDSDSDEGESEGEEDFDGLTTIREDHELGARPIGDVADRSRAAFRHIQCPAKLRSLRG